MSTTPAVHVSVGATTVCVPDNCGCVEPPHEWTPGDPCAACGSTNTGQNVERGGYCNGCGACDADDD